VSLAKVNYLLKAMIEKGLLKTENFLTSNHKAAYIYHLTPAGIEARARMTLPSWRAMLNDLASGDAGGDPEFVDWLSAESAFGRLSDVSLRRHWVDPTQPLEATVIRPSHGVLVTSATLTDPDFGDDPFHLARLRSATGRLETRSPMCRATIRAGRQRPCGRCSWPRAAGRWGCLPPFAA